MVFVSHDRRFLSKLSNRVLELDHGEVRAFGAGYVEYVESSGQEAPGVHGSLDPPPVVVGAAHQRRTTKNS
jgi:ATPase subunit of ABC transporter with duplicated ATPase domains